MTKKLKLNYYSRLGIKAGLKSAIRREKERKRRAGFNRFCLLLKHKSKLNKTQFFPPTYRNVRFFSQIGEKPKYGDTILFLKNKFHQFSPQNLPASEDGYLTLPDKFSLAENYSTSMFFLKRLFNLLLKQNVETVIIDYKECELLDLDASICMDLILACFINYYRKCTKKHRNVFIKTIKPINFKKDEIAKVLFSIGAPRNLKGLKINYKDILTFDLRVGDNKNTRNGGTKEIHETQIVDYVIDCLKKMNRSLTPEAETNLSKVVGEIMTNAEEHSDFRYRFAIGYFQESKNSETHIGIFKLVIFNFGQTIYESFNRPDCPNKKIVQQMKQISSEFTGKGWLKKAEFEEQTLWTLYSLQEGVTSKKDWKRGNGSIRFIDCFFKLKGDLEKDFMSKLTLISGNSRIIFDGTYPLIEKIKGTKGDTYKIMAFNNLGDIHQRPDKNYVNFTPEFFPGTMISANICINYQNLEEVHNGATSN